MHDRQMEVDKAMSYLGTYEGDSRHKHIVDTYNSYKPLPKGYKLKYSDKWCAPFVSVIAIECGSTDINPVECGCERMINLYKEKGEWVENDAYIPQAGDRIFYDWDDSGKGDDTGWSDHVGIVKDVKDGIITVVEGNKSDSVALRQIPINGKYIRGYGVPKYDDNTIPHNPHNTLPTQTTQEQDVTPVRTPVYGIDVSACQSAVDFSKVKAAGYSFVILRTTTRNGEPDKKFKQYYENAIKAGVEVLGVYKLSYAMNPPEAYNEAVKVVKLLQDVRIDKMTIWLDLENDGGQAILSKQQIEALARGFLDYCQASGYSVGIYCNEDWYNNHISDNLKAKYKFWAARYGENDGTVNIDKKPRFSGGYEMWQYTSHGHINGVKSYPNDYVDLDVRY